MAIVPSHFIWQRERAEHHSGAQRLYQNREEILVPRGPSASPEPCSLCAKTSARPVPRPSSTGACSSSVPLKATAHETQDSHRPSKMTKAQHTCNCMTKSGEWVCGALLWCYKKLYLGLNWNRFMWSIPVPLVKNIYHWLFCSFFFYRKWCMSRSFNGLDQWGVARLQHQTDQICLLTISDEQSLSKLTLWEMYSIGVNRVIAMYIVHIRCKEYVRKYYVKVCTCILLYHNPHHYLFLIVVQSTLLFIWCALCYSYVFNVKCEWNI